jgi:succinate dehydrogenase / fumarate reductase cytochrome b subunit
MTTTTAAKLPRTFVWRRLHSLFGLWIVLFLFEHLLTNSQAALLIGDDGNGFVRMVNAIHNLPYLEVIEIFLIGVPILFHAVLGVKYLWTGKFNSHRTNGAKPSLRENARNHAYTWQRITSWILLFLLIFHVVRFRFIEYPHSVFQNNTQMYLVRVGMDNGLYSVADRLGVKIFSHEDIERELAEIRTREAEKSLVDASRNILNEKIPSSGIYDSHKDLIISSAQSYLQKRAFVEALGEFSLKPTEVVCVAEKFGTATLLTVRDTFKNPYYVALYTIFVLAACFHGFNGLWTFLITWGMILSMASQKRMLKFAIGLMVLVTFLGLVAVWGTYWLNLKY